MLDVETKSSVNEDISFSILINNSDQFKNLVKEVNGAALTFLILQDTVYFIHMDTGFYVCKAIEVYDMTGFKEPIALRIDKKDFMKLLTDCVIEFTLNQKDSRLSLTYYNDKSELLYKYTLPYQQDLISNYLENLQAFSNYSEYPSIDMNGLFTIIKIAKSLQTSVRCDGESICIDNNNVYIYQDYKSVPFNVNSRLLYLLRTYSSKIYVIKEYFVVSMEDVVIAVNRYKSAGQHDFQFIKNSKSSFKIRFDLKNVIRLAKKLGLQSGNFILDFNRKMASFENDNKVFATNFTVLDTKSAVSKMSLEQFMESGASSELPIFRLPGSLFKGVFGNLSMNSPLTLYVKKSFIVIACEGLYIVFGKDSLNQTERR